MRGLAIFMKSKPHLFPHSYLPEASIKKLIFFLGPVRIYQPWFINPPEYFKGLEIEIVNPSEDFKPKGDFKAILSGYHAWAEQNYDRSRKEILKFRDNADQDDSETWEIRRLLKGAARPAPGIKGEYLPLKCHLLLHLAAEIERNHYDVADMMSALKEKGPVLSGALQDPGEAKGVFADTGDLTEIDMPENLNIEAMLDAWFGLFNGYLKENDLLITCNRHVMDYISARWDDKAGESPCCITFSLPAVSSQGDIIKVRELIYGIGEDPDRCMNELLLATKEVEKDLPRESLKGSVKYQLIYYLPMPGGRALETDDLLRYIAGKTIILMSSS